MLPMFSDPLFLLPVLACLVVLGILAMGIGGFAKSGEDRGKKSNRLMQYRIAAQFVAVLLIVGYIWIRGRS